MRIEQQLENYDGVNNYLDSCKEIVQNTDIIFLFGSAKGGEKVFSFLQKHNLETKIKYVVDNDKSKQGKYFHGSKIISLEELKQEYNKEKYGYNRVKIVIASGSAHIIKKQLIENGFSEDAIEEFVFTNMEMNPTPYEYIYKHKDVIDRVYSHLADEESKRVYIGLLNFKMTMDKKYLVGISDNEMNQYFDDIMKYTEKENFVDCGTYIGDTLDEYSKRMNGKWENFYCFEADKNIFDKLVAHVNEEGYQNVKTYNLGCWSEQGVVKFNEQGSGSSCVCLEGTNNEIEVNTLDDVLRGQKVSVIKMDIEGSEQRALLGAAGIIKKQRPKLAISIYHSLEDYIYVPAKILEMDNCYKVYIRHYREHTDSETICYAI